MKILDIYLSSILEKMQEAVIGIDTEGKITIINKRAEELLKIQYEEAIGKHIKEVVSDSRLLEAIKNKDIADKKDFIINGKNFVINRVPIKKGKEIVGAIGLFNDKTDYNKISQMLDKDEGYINILNTILDTANEWVVVVNKEGIIQMMSKAYKEFLNEPDPEGKHVTEVIENTRLHKVLETGTREVGEIQETRGNRMIAMRVPIIKDGKVVGAVGKTMFKDIGDFVSLSKKIDILEKELEYYKKELDGERVAKYSLKNITGNSEGIKKVKRMAIKVAQTNSNVLITGESGTGKELFAHAIHNASNRKVGPFVKINCAAIPADLLESELFGYEEGAFTGAKKGGKKGKFQLANGGTILLDEIGDMHLNMQAKLLRVLQEKELERVGGNIVQDIDVRIIASTNKDLEKLVKENNFREDLYYRLNVVTIKLPPLRDRREDIKELAITLKNKLTKRLRIYVEGISREALEYLEAYDWRGNIRELENVIERAINLLDSDLIIKPEHLPKRITKTRNKKYLSGNKKLKSVLEEVEREIISECLQKNKGNKNKTSKELGISRVNLYKKIDKYNIEDFKN